MPNTCAAGAASRPGDRQPTVRKVAHMSGRTLRLMGLGMVATAGAGFLRLGRDDEHRRTPTPTAKTSAWSSAAAGTPIPGSADMWKLQPSGTTSTRSMQATSRSLYQGASTNPDSAESLRASALPTPEQASIHCSAAACSTLTAELSLQRSTSTSRPSSTSVGLGESTILKNTMRSRPTPPTATGSTVFGYSQSSPPSRA